MGVGGEGGVVGGGVVGGGGEGGGGGGGEEELDDFVDGESGEKVGKEPGEEVLFTDGPEVGYETLLPLFHVDPREETQEHINTKTNIHKTIKPHSSPLSRYIETDTVGDCYYGVDYEGTAEDVPFYFKGVGGTD